MTDIRRRLYEPPVTIVDLQGPEGGDYPLLRQTFGGPEFDGHLARLIERARSERAPQNVVGVDDLGKWIT